MSQQTTFVFIDEDQQKKYSKSTLSAINAQVAKYAHKQRQTLPKSRSAPASPKASVALGDQDSPTHVSRARRRDRRTSDTTALSTGLALSEPVISHNKSSKEKAQPKRLSVSRRSSVEGVNQKKTTDIDFQLSDAKPEDLDILFDRLCRITKLPTYQAFPFFLNLEERRLAHYWFTEIIKEDFGMSKLQLEDTFQASLTKYPLAYQVPLRWIIAHSAQRLHRRTGSHSLAVVYRNQQEALTKLQEVLTDGSTNIDEAICSIQYTIVHDPDSRKIHLRGSDALVEARGGLEAVLRQCTVTQADHLFLSYSFAPFDIHQYEELESLKTKFFGALLAIQDSSAEYVQIKSQMESWASTVDLADCGDGGTSNMQKWAYTEQRDRVFGPGTVMGELIRRKFDRNATLIVKSRLFGSLFQLGAMLLEYETVEQKAIFLRQLEKSANVLAPSCINPLTGLPRIMPGGSIFMVGHVGRQIEEQKILADCGSKGISTAIMGIAALKLYGLLLDSMRERLHTYLQSWLLGLGNAYLKDGDISALSTVITQLWMQQTRSSVTPEPELGPEPEPEQEPESQEYLSEGHDDFEYFQTEQAVEMVQAMADDYLQYAELAEPDYFHLPDEQVQYVCMTNA